MNYDKTGSLIASLRKEKGLTQKELADKLGITDRAVSKWERGLGCPDISLLDDLSRILDVSILEILKGRKLDKDEIVNNESMIESMTYSKEHLQNKFKKYFNLVSFFIIVIIFAILLFSNLKSIYYLNKTYHSNFYDNSDNDLLVEIDEDIKKIKNNQGIYRDDEYQEILVFIDKLEKNLKQQNNLYYLTKNNYTYSEIVDFYNDHQNYIYLETSNYIQSIYEIVHNYNPDIVNDVVHYYTMTNSLLERSNKLWEQLKEPYHNSAKINNEIVASVHGFILNEIRRDSMLLKDIVEVGDINE